jgi:hypothetical protein
VEKAAATFRFLTIAHYSMISSARASTEGGIVGQGPLQWSTL